MSTVGTLSFAHSSQYCALVGHLEFSRMHDRLREAVTATQRRYHCTNETVSRALANARAGQPSAAAAREFLQAREARAYAQRELAVLVPLLRLSTAALQQWRGQEAPAVAARLAMQVAYLTQPVPLSHKAWKMIPGNTRRNVPAVGTVERNAALELVRACPAVFYRAPRALPAGEPKGALRDRDLFVKIVTTTSLSTKERQRLAQALRIRN